MMRITSLSIVLLSLGALLMSAVVPSRYVSRTGHLHVETHSKYLDVIADNYQVYCEINAETGAVRMRGLLKSFDFKMGALDKAFNSERVNLTEFSKFNYIGRVTNLSAIDFAKPGIYPIQVKGDVMIGDFKRITPASGTLTIDGDGTMRAKADFPIRIEEASVATINRIMKEKLPSILAIDADRLGISRDIELSLKATFRGR